MKNLNVSIYQEYFDEIKAGKKKVEYREIKDYYTRKLIVDGRVPGTGPLKAKHYDTITFFTKKGDRMKVEWKGLFLYPKNNPKWYAIKLGNIISDEKGGNTSGANSMPKGE